MDVRRILAAAALAVAAVAANATAAGAASNPSFSGKLAVKDVDAICVTQRGAFRPV